MPVYLTIALTVESKLCPLEVLEDALEIVSIDLTDDIEGVWEENNALCLEVVNYDKCEQLFKMANHIEKYVNKMYKDDVLNVHIPHSFDAELV